MDPPQPPVSYPRMPFRCPLRWALVSGKQKGQSEAQLVIRREAGISPATDARSLGAAVRHVLLVYAGNRAQPEVSMCLPEAGVRNDAAAVFRYYLTRKRLLFDCPSSNGQSGSMVDLFFPTSADLQRTINVLSGLGIKPQSCDQAMPPVARCHSSAGHTQRSLFNGTPPLASTSPDILRATQAFSPPLMIRSREGRVTPVQLQRVARRKRVPTPTLPHRVSGSQGSGPESYRTLPEDAMYRPSSVPANLQTPNHSDMRFSRFFPVSDSQPVQSRPTLSQSSSGLNRWMPNPSRHTTPQSRTGPNSQDENADCDLSSQLDPFLFAGDEADIESGHPSADSQGDSQGSLVNPRPISMHETREAATSKRNPDISRSTQCSSTYQNAQVQVEEDDTPRLMASDADTKRMFGMLDEWENMRRGLWMKIESTPRLDDATLGVIVSDYQTGLEASLSRLPSIH